ncbi:hypothetical protein [Gordonia sihwensis]|uniref:hypothetical protein n=1 Tax=Gordonia sihwensis TaxID=173559 RepID=UPI0005EDD965|nr:hypothetical protein [Gordonia sihwensis]KJR10571.1 hypothetical protein UG54_00865 [Gordonia sihwensis]
MTDTHPTDGQLLTQLADLAATVRAAGIDAADIARTVQAAAVPVGAMLPDLTVVVVRDPDGGDEVTVFADDNQQLTPTTIVVDAGSGWAPDGWQTFVHDTLGSTSGALHQHLQAVLADPPGRDYIERKELR